MYVQLKKVAFYNYLLIYWISKPKHKVNLNIFITMWFLCILLPTEPIPYLIHRYLTENDYNRNDFLVL